VLAAAHEFDIAKYFDGKKDEFVLLQISITKRTMVFHFFFN